jgi:hypothetical protein
VPLVFSSSDPAKQKVENLQFKMVGAQSENKLIRAGAERSLNK